MLNVTTTCVPHFLQLESHWLELVKVGAGASQGAINAMVIPRLANQLTPSKHSYTSIASTLTGACLPVWCIIYLDHTCLGRWTAWWVPCAQHERQQFNLRFVRGDVILQLMKADDLCSFNVGQVGLDLHYVNCTEDAGDANVKGHGVINCNVIKTYRQ